MKTMNNRLAALAIGLVVAGLATPSLAQRNEDHVSANRASALHECTKLEERTPQYAYGVGEIEQYRACMAEYGQPE